MARGMILVYVLTVTSFGYEIWRLPKIAIIIGNTRFIF
jgi:hypothetical protein